MEGCGLEASVLYCVCLHGPPRAFLQYGGYVCHLPLPRCHRRPGEPWGCRVSSGPVCCPEPTLGNFYRRQLNSTLLVSCGPSSPSNCD